MQIMATITLFIFHKTLLLSFFIVLPCFSKIILESNSFLNIEMFFEFKNIQDGDRIELKLQNIGEVTIIRNCNEWYIYDYCEKSQLEDKDSIFYYYKKLVQLRKEMPILVYGDYQLLMPEDQDIFTYVRTFENEKLLVVANFHEREREYDVPEEFREATKIIGNYEEEKAGMLQPYEARIYYKK